MNEKNNIMGSALKLMRAMRRHPPKPAEGFSPAAGRFLHVLSENNGVSSRELAELLDIRPSSLSELLGRMENEGLITRTVDEADKRVSRVSLSDKGKEAAQKITEERAAEAQKLSSCFTEEEAQQFCALCDKLSAHLESLPGEEHRPPFGHGFPPPHMMEGGYGGMRMHGEFPEDCPPPPPHHHHHHHHGPCGRRGAFGQLEWRGRKNHEEE